MNCSSKAHHQVPFWHLLPTKENADIETAFKVMNDIARSIFLEEKELLRLGEKQKVSSFLEVLATAYDDETRSQLSDQEVLDNCLVMLFAGSETTAWTMAWSLHFLLRHPAAYQNVITEIDAVIPDVGNFTLEQCERLTYLDAVVKETMRVHPTLIGTAPRVLTQDFTLGDWIVKKGSILISYFHEIQCNPKIWGPDAAEFIPERWLGDTAHPATHNSFAYFPFGTGRRACLGRFFAEQETRVVLALFLKSFSFRLIENHPPIEGCVKLPTIQMKEGLHLQLTPRQKS